MIVDMKKITLLCLDSQKVQALEALRDLSIMHVSIMKNVETNDVAVLSKRLAEINRAGLALTERKQPGKTASDLPADQLVDRVNAVLDDIASAEKTADTLTKELDRIRAWGNFSPKQIRQLEKSGIYVCLCISSPKEIPAAPEGAVLKLISSDSALAYFAVISRQAPDMKGFTVIQLPETSKEELENGIREQESLLVQRKTELDALAGSLNELRAYKAELEEKLEFAQNRDSMSVSGEISHITGYVPVDGVENLRAAALKEGWALLLADPEADDQEVPTYIRKPKWMDIMDPLFDFIGVTPGYRESDVNLFFLIFFPIFFGMLIGDAGYGVLFITSALICKYILFRGKEAARLPLNLFLMLSSTSLIWGWLNGSWFGIPRDVLPSWLQGISFLADPANNPLAQEIAKKLDIKDMGSIKDKFIQWLCFLLAAVQLSAARLFKTLTDLKKSWRALGNLGWAMLIWGNFFTAVNLIVFPGTFPQFAFWLYGAGVVLIIGTITAEAALNLPFALIGSFVDVLSYIRLFAVGLSGAYIAENFNKMGGMILGALPSSWYVVGILCLILVAVFGHILNIALGFLGVLVHAIRLNTLEFSNHMEMQWGGTRYKPFAKNNKLEIKNHQNKNTGV